MLKTTILLEKLTFEVLKVGDNKVNRFGIGSNNMEIAKKLKKLFKTQKLSKSRKNHQKVEIYLILALKKPD